MDYSPSLAVQVEEEMKSEAGHFVDTTTVIEGSAKATITIPTGIPVLKGGSLINTAGSEAGASISFDTDPAHCVGHSHSPVAYYNFAADGKVSIASSFGPQILASKVWVEGENIKIELHNIELGVPNTVSIHLEYLVFG